MILFYVLGLESDDEGTASVGSKMSERKRRIQGNKAYHAIPKEEPDTTRSTQHGTGDSSSYHNATSAKYPEHAYPRQGDSPLIQRALNNGTNSPYKSPQERMTQAKAASFHSFSSALPNSRYVASHAPYFEKCKPRNSSKSVDSGESSAMSNGNVAGLVDEGCREGSNSSLSSSTLGYQGSSDSLGSQTTAPRLVGASPTCVSASTGDNIQLGKSGSEPETSPDRHVTSDTQGAGPPSTSSHSIMNTPQYLDYEEETYHRNRYDRPNERSYSSRRQYHSDEGLHRTEYHDDTSSDGDTTEGEDGRRPTAYIRHREGGRYLYQHSCL